MQETTFNELADLALRQSGQTIPASKAYLMEARLSTIARRENFATLDDLVHCLKARPNPRFEQEVAAALTGKATRFFGDRDLLDARRRQLDREGVLVATELSRHQQEDEQQEHHVDEWRQLDRRA